MMATLPCGSPPGSRSYRLELPYERPPKALTGNARSGHWSARHRATRQVICDVVTVARAAKVPVGRHLVVGLWWAPGDRRKRDADNLWPLLKACCDGLARGTDRWPGLRLVPDDDPAHMTKLAPVIVPPPAGRALWLTVEVLV
jgi:crossover junction endodeoxyribonuclease RusA